MRRNYISPEFVNSKIYGSFNSYEESNFFGSKMLEIEDLVDIIDQNIIYYQNSKNEQIDANVETAQNSTIYSSFENKNKNHVLTIDDSQLDAQKKSNTRWLLDIDLKSILTEFVFANVKKERTFQSLTNDMVVSKDVNVFIRNYITNNVLDRYKLSNIDLYVDYLDLKTNTANNFPVEEGDSLHVPRRPNSVSVVGEVLNTSTVTFQAEFGVGDYLDLAGGLNDAADKSRIFVIYPDGRSQLLKRSLFSSRNNLLPGSTIVVPRDARPFDAIKLTSIITPILADLATSAAAIAAISND